MLPLAGVVALALAASSSAGSSAGTLAVQVQHRPSAAANVRIVLSNAQPLPEGGYYYAVVVLEPYRRYTRAAPPPCATSSNMERTSYGYPSARHVVSLSLAPGRSRTRHWCSGGVYAGAIYAVPHAPPCESRYPCRSEPYEPPSPCWGVEGRRVCGVVALPPQYRYPDGLPKPLAAGTRMLAHFKLVFR